MCKSPSRKVCGSKGVKTHRTSRFILACLCTALTAVAVAIGDREQASQHSDTSSVGQGDRHSPPLHKPEIRKNSPPPASDSAYESDEDCE